MTDREFDWWMFAGRLVIVMSACATFYFTGKIDGRAEANEWMSGSRYLFVSPEYASDQKIGYCRALSHVDASPQVRELRRLAECDVPLRGSSDVEAP